MDVRDEANWWLFSVDPEDRRERITATDTGAREVNPATADGRHLLEYRSYIGLDRLLSCQAPSSRVPDERVFIVTHQLFELAFKQMIFDLSVVAATLSRLLEKEDEEFLYLCSSADEEFWLPSLTASSRIIYAGRTVLPVCLGYLAPGENGSENFSSREFRSFRPNLQPASGFQSAQFRLIQRALGKENFLGIRIFPAEEYWKNYESGEEPGPARVVDPVILRADVAIAAPSPGSPFHIAATLDDLAHRVLARLSPPGGKTAPGVAAISPDRVEEAFEGFYRLLSAQRNLQEQAGEIPADAQEKDRRAKTFFRGDLEAAVERENRRRATLGPAREGARYLRALAPRKCLVLVLDRLSAADTALHGPQEESFLSQHLHITARRIKDLSDLAHQEGKPEPPRGTGGGGVPYLAHVKRYLLPLFPALVAWKDDE